MREWRFWRLISVRVMNGKQIIMYPRFQPTLKRSKKGPQIGIHPSRRIKGPDGRPGLQCPARTSGKQDVHTCVWLRSSLSRMSDQRIHLTGVVCFIDSSHYQNAPYLVKCVVASAMLLRWAIYASKSCDNSIRHRLFLPQSLLDVHRRKKRGILPIQHRNSVLIKVAH